MSYVKLEQVYVKCNNCTKLHTDSFSSGEITAKVTAIAAGWLVEGPTALCPQCWELKGGPTAKEPRRRKTDG